MMFDTLIEYPRYLADKLFRGLEAICKIKLGSFSYALSQLPALNSQYSSSPPGTLALWNPENYKKD